MEDKNRIIIFDTTMRDGEQSPGASMSLEEKIQISRVFDELGIDIVEAGFPIASPGDFEAVTAISKSIKNSIFEITLTPNNTKRLAALRGELDGNLRLIEKRLEVNIYSRDNHFTVKGHEHKPQIATRVLKSLYDETAASSEINSENVHLHLRQFESDKSILKGQIEDSFSNVLSVIRTKKGNIKPRGVNQNKYIQHIHTHDFNFVICLLYTSDSAY